MLIAELRVFLDRRVTCTGRTRVLRILVAPPVPVSATACPPSIVIVRATGG